MDYEIGEPNNQFNCSADSTHGLESIISIVSTPSISDNDVHSISLILHLCQMI